MTNWNWYIIFVFCVGYWFKVLVDFIKDRTENPHRWSCPQTNCNFKFKASSKELYDKVKAVHIEDHVPF